MGRATLSGNPPVEITLRRSARARRVSLRVSAIDGRVTLSCPTSMKTAEAMAFAEEKSHWIRENLSRRPADVRPEIGSTIAFEGRELPIMAGQFRSARIDGAALVVPDAPAMVAARVKAFLKLQARGRIQAAAARHAAALGRSHGKITLRDTRSRWGSCSHAGNLMFSWRLVMASPDVLDYVVAHEVAHLAEMNHSAAFWAHVARLCPGYAVPRRWLRRHGHGLHRYRFDD